FSVEVRIRDFRKQDMRLPVDHPITLADDRLPDSLGQVTFAGTGWTQKKGVLMASDERCGRQIEDQAAIHLLVEVEIEVIERHLRIAKLCLFPSPLQESVAAASQIIGDQTGEEVDGYHRFCLGLLQAGFKYGGHAPET